MCGYRQRKQNNMLGCALACLLPCYASAEEWEAWDRAMAEASRLLEETSVLSGDVASPVQQGAILALRAGHRKRAKQAYEVTLKQWLGLGRDDKVGAVMRAIDALIDEP